MIGQMVRFAHVAVLVVVSGLVLSCTMKRVPSGSGFSQTMDIQDIRVTEGTGKTVVEIEGEEPMIYTTFRLSDPDRLVVDMAGVSLARFSEVIELEKGPIRMIRPVTDGTSRLEFELVGSVGTDVRTEGINLIVEVYEVPVKAEGFRFFENEETPPLEKDVQVVPEDLQQSLEKPEEAVQELPLPEIVEPFDASAPLELFIPGMVIPDVDPEPDVEAEIALAEAGVQETEPPQLLAKADDVPLEAASVEEEASAVLEKPSEIPEIRQETEMISAEPEIVTSLPVQEEEQQQRVEKEESLPTATKVFSVRFDQGKDLQLIVASDGLLSPRIFFIGFGNKKRLVIDLPGVSMTSKQHRVVLDDDRVRQVRIGQHKKKLRLVLDLLAPITYSVSQDQGELHLIIIGPARKESVAVPDLMISDLPASPSPDIASPIASPPSLSASLPVEVMQKTTASEDEDFVDKATDVEDAEKKEAKKKVLLLRERREKARLKRESVAAEKAEAISKTKVPAKYIGKKISLDFQNADVTDVIRLLADVSELNFVMGDDVSGQITLKMDGVPWDQALDIILEIRNLGQVRDGDIIRIATLSNLTRQRNEKAEARETKIRAEELVTRVIYINYAKAGNMKILLQKLLSTRGEIMLASRVNALVVKDTEANLSEVERLAKKLDTKTPQVLIEARVVEVKPVFKQSLGVKWGLDFKTTSGGNRIGVGGNSGNVFASTPDFSVNLPAASPLGGIGFTFGRFTENPFQLDLRLSAGESQEMTRIVSTPKIMVLDNHEALIKQGESIPFQSSSANGGTNVQLVDASLQLKVTPHISPDGGILLDLELTKNEPGPPVQGADNPSIFEKEVSTHILLMDGETMVIGGIYETKKIESESGIPFLKNIPYFGWLFKNKEKREETTELLIFLTPTIME